MQDWLSEMQKNSARVRPTGENGGSTFRFRDPRCKHLCLEPNGNERSLKIFKGPVHFTAIFQSAYVAVRLHCLVGPVHCPNSGNLLLNAWWTIQLALAPKRRCRTPWAKRYSRCHSGESMARSAPGEPLPRIQPVRVKARAHRQFSSVPFLRTRPRRLHVTSGDFTTTTYLLQKLSDGMSPVRVCSTPF